MMAGDRLLRRVLEFPRGRGVSQARNFKGTHEGKLRFLYEWWRGVGVGREVCNP